MTINNIYIKNYWIIWIRRGHLHQILTHNKASFQLNEGDSGPHGNMFLRISKEYHFFSVLCVPKRSPLLLLKTFFPNTGQWNFLCCHLYLSHLSFVASTKVCLHLLYNFITLYKSVFTDLKITKISSLPPQDLTNLYLWVF